MTKKKPVLLIIFNRPEKALRVLDAIREYAPTKIYISADGPRENNPSDAELCLEARNAILNAIDWDCEIHTRFLEINIGCGKGPASAITWFFESEKDGIILEDDFVPNQSFFSNTSILLDRFETIPEVMMIHGINYFDKNSVNRSNYFFSKCTQSPCFGTWRESWEKFSFTISESNAEIYKVIGSVIQNKSLIKIWTDKLLSIKIGNKDDAWDYQWSFSIWKNNGLCLTPTKNLVSNIGYGDNAIHDNVYSSFLHDKERRDFTFNGKIEKIDQKLDQKMFELLHDRNQKKQINIKELFLRFYRPFREKQNRDEIFRTTPRFQLGKTSLKNKPWAFEDIECFQNEFHLYFESTFWNKELLNKITGILHIEPQTGLDIASLKYKKTKLDQWLWVDNEWRNEILKQNFKEHLIFPVFLISTDNIPKSKQINLLKINKNPVAHLQNKQFLSFQFLLVKIEAQETYDLLRKHEILEKKYKRYFFHVEREYKLPEYKKFYKNEPENIFWILYEKY